MVLGQPKEKADVSDRGRDIGVFEGLPDEIPAFTRDVGVLQKRSVKCPSAARLVRVDERYVPASRKSSGGNETVQ